MIRTRRAQPYWGKCIGLIAGMLSLCAPALADAYVRIPTDTGCITLSTRQGTRCQSPVHRATSPLLGSFFLFFLLGIVLP
jgi:hypothetical protein